LSSRLDFSSPPGPYFGKTPLRARTEIDPVDVLTGFVNEEGEALGRPVSVALDQAGALLVADDVGNRIWRVTAAIGTASRWSSAARG